MRTNAIRLASGVALFTFGLAFPAFSQFMSNYPLIVVPPPAQDYALPKSAPKSPPPEKPKPPDAPAPAPAGRYQGRTLVPD
jgi:hypothetical protein